MVSLLWFVALCMVAAVFLEPVDHPERFIGVGAVGLAMLVFVRWAER